MTSGTGTDDAPTPAVALYNIWADTTSAQEKSVCSGTVGGRVMWRKVAHRRSLAAPNVSFAMTLFHYIERFFSSTLLVVRTL